MVKKQLLAAAILGFSMSAHAADFSDADAKFAARDTSEATAKAAVAAYKAIIDQGVTGAELVRAGEGYLRSIVFEGSHYNPIATDKADRKAIFKSCQESAVNVISPAKLGFASPVYYYFKASCIAYEAEVSTPLERLGLLLPLNTAVDAGLAVAGGDTYEGGGLRRVRAAVLGNPEAKGVPGAYNPAQALILINQAIASEAYPGGVEGSLFCENFRRKVGIQIELKDAGAKSLAAQTVADFQSYLADGFIPEFIRAETADCIATVKGYL